MSDKNLAPDIQDDSSEAVIAELIKANPDVKSIKHKNLKNVAIAIQRSEAFSGPLPHPQHLEQYNSIIPNGADRLMKQVELQAEHRRNIENTSVRCSIMQSVFGQLIAAILTIGFGIGGFILLQQGKEIAGGIMLGVPVLGLISKFLPAISNSKFKS